MKIAERAVRHRFVTAHPAALAVRHNRGQLALTEPVLPTIAPELDYDSLDVKDGMQAQAVYLEAIAPGTTPERRAAIDAGLRKYCARDTEAMMVLAARQQVVG